MDADAAQCPMPNLFIVGAPKCGTTSVYEYLRGHHDIYFPHDDNDYARVKEPNHLCPELDIGAKDAIRDRDAYLALYRGSAGARWRGDASTNYLFSEIAANAIRCLSPQARIIIMLRPPLDWMRSYHSELLRHRHEDIADFHDAVAASEDRSHGRRIPASTGVPRCLDYLAMARFTPQVQRYYDVFGRDAVKVILLEDLATSPARTFKQILEFLDVDTEYRPQFSVHNETPRHGRTERLLRAGYRHASVRTAIQHVVPSSARRRILALVRRAESRHASEDPRDRQLRLQCAADIGQLSALIDRDLDHWLNPPARQRPKQRD